MEKYTELLSATIERTAPGITTVRFHADVRLTTEVLAEVMRHRSASIPGSQAVIVVIPEGTDYDAHVMTVDHYAVHDLAYRTTALAIVCHERGLMHLLRLYFAYYPPVFEVKFCEEYDEAFKWLVENEVTRSAA